MKVLYKIKKILDDIISKGFLYILTGNTLNKLISFTSSILVVKIISKQDFGLLTSIDSFYSYLYLISGFGLSYGLLKFCNLKNSHFKNLFYVRISLIHGTIAQFFLVFVLMFISFNNKSLSFRNFNFYFTLLALYPILYHVLNCFQCYMRALQLNRVYSLSNVILTLLTLIFSVFFGSYFNISGIISARYLAIILTLFFCVRNINLEELRLFSQNMIENVRPFYKLSISIMMANLFSMIMPINELYLINVYIQDLNTLADYKVATMIPLQIQFITTSVVIFAFPQISQLNNTDEIISFTKKITIINTCIVITLSLIGIVSTPYIIPIAYGSKYLDSIILSQYYWIVFSINAIFRMIPMNILPALGITFNNTFISLFFCILHGLLLIFSLKNYGIYGAACSLAFVYLLSGFIYWIYYFYALRYKS